MFRVLEIRTCDFVSLSGQQAIKQTINCLPVASKQLITCHWPALTLTILNFLNYNFGSNTAQHPSPEGPQFLSW